MLKYEGVTEKKDSFLLPKKLKTRMKIVHKNISNRRRSFIINKKDSTPIIRVSQLAEILTFFPDCWRSLN